MRMFGFVLEIQNVLIESRTVSIEGPRSSCAYCLNTCGENSYDSICKIDDAIRVQNLTTTAKAGARAASVSTRVAAPLPVTMYALFSLGEAGNMLSLAS
jgi:hypothetical protein